jgi:hypothetical protein
MGKTARSLIFRETGAPASSSTRKHLIITGSHRHEHGSSRSISRARERPCSKMNVPTVALTGPSEEAEADALLVSATAAVLRSGNTSNAIIIPVRTLPFIVITSG